MTMLDFVFPEEVVAAPLTFGRDEPLELAVEDAWRSQDRNGFTLMCRVLTGEQRGEVTLLNFRAKLPSGDWNWNTTAFLRVFFSKEELKTGMDIAKLVGHAFTCVSRVKNANGKDYQNFDSFKDLGKTEAMS